VVQQALGLAELVQTASLWRSWSAHATVGWPRSSARLRRLHPTGQVLNRASARAILPSRLL